MAQRILPRQPRFPRLQVRQILQIVELVVAQDDRADEHEEGRVLVLDRARPKQEIDDRDLVDDRQGIHHRSIVFLREPADDDRVAVGNGDGAVDRVLLARRRQACRGLTGEAAQLDAVCELEVVVLADVGLDADRGSGLREAAQAGAGLGGAGVEDLGEGFLASPAFYASFAHKQDHVDRYRTAVEKTFKQLAECISRGAVEGQLAGPTAHSGFHRLT